MRHAGVHEMQRAVEAGDFGVGVELEVLGLGHRDAHVLADHFRGQRAGDGLEGDFFQHDFPEMRGEAAETTRAVAAHFRLAAVRIVVAETEIRAFLGGLDGEQPIRPDPAVAVAERGDGVGVEFLGEREVAVVNDDEVVAGAIHFEEVEEHVEMWADGEMVGNVARLSQSESLGWRCAEKVRASVSFSISIMFGARLRWGHGPAAKCGLEFRRVRGIRCPPMSIACPVCEMTDVLTHSDHYECVTCGHEWPLEALPEEVAGERVVKDAYGNVLATGDVVAMIKDLKLKGSSQVLKVGTEVETHPPGGRRP